MPGLVGEGVGADHRLVGRHRDAGVAGHHVAGADDLGGVDTGFHPEVPVAGPQGHDHLFEAGVAGPLADPVDGDLGLTGAGPDPGQGVCGGHPEVVVTVGRPDDAVASRGLGAEPVDELEVLLRRRVADGVRDVERGGARFDGGGADLDEKVRVRPARVLAAELDVAAVGLGVSHHLPGPVDDISPAHLELVIEVEIGGGDKGVDPRLRRRLDRFPDLVDVAWMGAGQAGDDRTVLGPDLAGDPPHRLEIVGARRRETGLDDVDAETRELAGDLELLGAREAGAG